MLVAWLFAAVLLPALGSAKLVRPGLQPFRGWTSWDLSALKGHDPYGHEWLNATNIRAQSTALAASGLQDHGFDHINIDSFWSYNPTQAVDQYGRWATNATRFPDGMANISAFVHANGQKFGLYMNPGVAVAAVKFKTPVEGTNCTADQIALRGESDNFVRGNPFGDGYAIDWSHRCSRPYIRSFAKLLVEEFQIDFLKIDAVTPGSAKDNATDWPEPPYNSYDNSRDIAEWSAALEATGRPVWLAISWELDPNFASELVPFANSWRTSMDIDCYCDVLVKWPAVKRVFAQVVPWVPYAGHSRSTGRPDLDSLNLGNGDSAWGQGLSAIEERTYASFWAIVGASIYTGVDLTLLNPKGAGFAMLTHPALAAINLHPITAAPDNSVINASTHALLQTWRTDYGNGTQLLALFNLDDTPRSMRWFAPDRKAFSAMDVWSGAPHPCPLCATGATGELNLAPHASLLLRLEFKQGS
eukprot:COSAG05_NODE_1197_length_5557_cov_6.456761_3_plen_472_part_00